MKIVSLFVILAACIDIFAQVEENEIISNANMTLYNLDENSNFF